MEGFLYTLLGILAGLLIVLRVRVRLTKKTEKQLNRMEEKLDKMEVYLDGLPKEAKKGTLLGKGFNKGILAMDKNNWNEAIGIFRKLLPDAESSQKVALLNLIGNCFYHHSKLDPALGHYKESLKLAEEIKDKEGIVANLNNIGLVYADKKDYDAAIRDFNKAIELDPNIAIAFNNRGAAYKNKGDYDAAIRDYNKAIELDPNYADAFYNRGNAYDEKKDYDSAIRDFDKAIEIDSNHAKAMANMGLVYEGKGDKEKARIWWEKALERQEYLPDGGEAVRRWIKELEE